MARVDLRGMRVRAFVMAARRRCFSLVVDRRRSSSAPPARFKTRAACSIDDPGLWSAASGDFEFSMIGVGEPLGLFQHFVAQSTETIDFVQGIEAPNEPSA